MAKSWITSEQITWSIFQYLNRQSINIDDFFVIFKIKDDTMLAKDIKKHIYLYCSEGFYLEEGGANLKNIIEQYNNEQMILFTENYLGKVSFANLQREVMEFLFRHRKKPREKNWIIFGAIYQINVSRNFANGYT